MFLSKNSCGWHRLLTLITFSALQLLLQPTPAIAESPVVVVAGAGPASLIFALRYLQLDPQVRIKIFERRSKPLRYQDTPTECIAGDNAFGFGIGSRAKDSLDRIPGLTQAIEAIGHPVGLQYGISGTWMVNRREMCAEFIHILETEYGIDGRGRLEISFNCSITGVQKTPDGQCSVIVEDVASSESKVVPYSLLVGADGSNSAVRSFLASQGHLTGKRYKSGIVWNALQLPAQPKIENLNNLMPIRSKRDRGRLLPRYKDRYVMLMFRPAKFANSKPFDARTPQELRNAIQKNIPNVTEFPPDEVLQTFLDEKPGGSHYMILDNHYVPEFQTILVGDAAVGMYSLLGQGCAYSMNSATFLAEELAKNSWSNVSVTLEKVSVRNLREGKAIADLNLISHLTRVPIVKLAAFLAFPNIVKSLNDPSIPYSSIVKKNQWVLGLSNLFWRLGREPASLSKGELI